MGQSSQLQYPPKSADSRGWSMGRRPSMAGPSSPNPVTPSHPYQSRQEAHLSPHSQQQQNQHQYQHQQQHQPQHQYQHQQDRPPHQQPQPHRQVQGRGADSDPDQSRESRDTLYRPSFSTSFTSASEGLAPTSAGFSSSLGYLGSAMQSSPSFDILGTLHTNDDDDAPEPRGQDRRPLSANRLQARSSVYEHHNPSELADFLKSEPPSLEPMPARTLNTKASSRSMRNPSEGGKAKKKGFFGKLLNVGGALRRNQSSVDLDRFSPVSASSSGLSATAPVIDPLRAFPKSAPPRGQDNGFSQQQQQQQNQGEGTSGKHKYPPAAASAMAHKQSVIAGLPPSCRTSVGAESQRTTKRSGSITSVTRKPLPNLTDEEKALLQELELNPPKPSNEPFRPRPGFRSRTTSDPNLSQAQVAQTLAGSSTGGSLFPGNSNPFAPAGARPDTRQDSSSSAQGHIDLQQLQRDASALQSTMQSAQERRGTSKSPSGGMRPSTAGGRLGGHGQGPPGHPISGSRHLSGRPPGHPCMEVSQDASMDGKQPGTATQASSGLPPGPMLDRHGMANSSRGLAPPSRPGLLHCPSTPDLPSMGRGERPDSGDLDASQAESYRRGSADETSRTTPSRVPDPMGPSSQRLSGRSLRRPPSRGGLVAGHGARMSLYHRPSGDGSPRASSGEESRSGDPDPTSLPTTPVDLGKAGSELNGPPRGSHDNNAALSSAPSSSSPTVESGLQVTFDVEDETADQYTTPATADADKVSLNSPDSSPSNGRTGDRLAPIAQEGTELGSGFEVSGAPAARTHSAAQLWVAYLDSQRKAQQASEALEAERARCRQLIQRCMAMLELQRRLSSQSSSSVSGQSLTGTDWERRSSDASSSSPSVSARPNVSLASAASRRHAHEEEKLAALVEDLRAYVGESRWEMSHDHHPRANLTTATKPLSNHASVAGSPGPTSPATRPLSLAPTKGRERMRPPMLNGHGQSTLMAPSVPGTRASHLRRPRTSESLALDRGFGDWKGIRTVPMIGGGGGGGNASRRSAYILGP